MGSQITKMQLARLQYLYAQVNIPQITLFLDRDIAGIAGARETHSTLEACGFKSKIFNWNQTFNNLNGSSVNISEKIKDPCDMSVTQIRWLKQKGII